MRVVFLGLRDGILAFLSLLSLLATAAAVRGTDDDEAQAALALAAARRSAVPVKVVKECSDCTDPACKTGCGCAGDGFYCPDGKCPVAAGKKLPTYDELLARVLKGERLVLAVGYVSSSGCDGRVGSLPGVPTGVYDCFLSGGVPKMERRGEPAALPKAPGSGSTRPTSAISADALSSPSAGSTPTVLTTTLAPFAALPGSTENCPPSG